MRYPRNFDKSIAALLAHIPKKYEPAMVWITNIGGFWFGAFVLLALLMSAVLFHERQLLPSIAVTAAVTPLAELAKLVTRRKRPETLYVEQMRFKTYSFPSGHSYVSALMAGYAFLVGLAYVISPFVWIIGAVLAVFILLVGISRVYLGAHFPSDVLAGWLLAFLILLVTAPFRELLP